MNTNNTAAGSPDIVDFCSQGGGGSSSSNAAIIMSFDATSRRAFQTHWHCRTAVELRSACEMKRGFTCRLKREEQQRRPEAVRSQIS
jgi:hypothetical protein